MIGGKAPLPTLGGAVFLPISIWVVLPSFTSCRSWFCAPCALWAGALFHGNQHHPEEGEEGSTTKRRGRKAAPLGGNHHSTELNSTSVNLTNLNFSLNVSFYYCGLFSWRERLGSKPHQLTCEPCLLPHHKKVQTSRERNVLTPPTRPVGCFSWDSFLYHGRGQTQQDHCFEKT